MDHNYKLFSDGRLFDVRGTEMHETELDVGRLGAKARQAKEKLRRVISEAMKGPISGHALKVVDAFGNPL